MSLVAYDFRLFFLMIYELSAKCSEVRCWGARRQIMSDENEEMNLLCSSLEATEIGYDEALVKVFELIAKRVSAR